MKRNENDMSVDLRFNVNFQNSANISKNKKIFFPRKNLQTIQKIHNKL